MFKSWSNNSKVAPGLPVAQAVPLSEVHAQPVVDQQVVILIAYLQLSLYYLSMHSAQMRNVAAILIIFNALNNIADELDTIYVKANDYTKEYIEKGKVMPINISGLGDEYNRLIQVQLINLAANNTFNEEKKVTRIIKFLYGEDSMEGGRNRKSRRSKQRRKKQTKRRKYKK
jgi:hypothetical protein